MSGWPYFAVAWAIVAGIGIALDPTRTPWIVTGVMIGVNVTMTVVTSRRGTQERRP